VLLVLGIVVFAIKIPVFFSMGNFLNVLLNSSSLGILVLAETMVLLTGHFDLSIESTVGFTAMLAAWLMGTGEFSSHLGLNPILAIVIMIAVGALIGLFNGFFVIKLRMNAFIVTLAMMIVLRGATINLTNGNIMRKLPDVFKAVSVIKLGGKVSLMILVFLILYIIYYFILNYSRFGRSLYAVGDNKDAAYASGINTGRVTIYAFMMAGALAAVAGWILAARFEAVAPNLGNGMVFEVMAAAVIGGISLSGGKGSIVGALGGVLLLGMIQNVLNLTALSPYYVDMIRGGIVFVAVLIDSLKYSVFKR
jgi:ribose/xylose/arabinose/galactoside ABC-type transport system permease subunit